MLQKKIYEELIWNSKLCRLKNGNHLLIFMNDVSRYPVINEYIVTLFNIMTVKQYSDIKSLKNEIYDIVKSILKEFNPDL